MNFLSKLFRPQPEPPFVEYPDGRLESARAALEQGLRVYRKKGVRRPASISWQGQGSRPDSYHIVDLGLNVEIVSFRDAAIDLEKACTAEGVNYEALRGSSKSELHIASLSEKDAAVLLEALLVKHVGVKPFEESGDYSVGFEYEKKN